MNWVPNWRLNLSQTGGWKKNGDCGSNIKQKLVSAVDTDSLCVWLANDVPNTSGFMQFYCKIRLQSQIRPFLGVRSTNPLSRASGLGKLTRHGGVFKAPQLFPTTNFWMLFGRKSAVQERTRKPPWAGHPSSWPLMGGNRSLGDQLAMRCSLVRTSNICCFIIWGICTTLW